MPINGFKFNFTCFSDPVNFSDLEAISPNSNRKMVKLFRATWSFIVFLMVFLIGLRYLLYLIPRPKVLVYEAYAFTPLNARNTESCNGERIVIQ